MTDDERADSVAEFNDALLDTCDPASSGDDNLITTVYGFGINEGTGMTSGLGRPEECFKIDAKPDWLSGYSVEFTPMNDGVSWGEIDWFKDLEYEARTFEASDVVTDICELFIEEVENVAFDDDWTHIGFDTRATDGDGGEGGNNFYITEWRVGPAQDDPATTEDEGLSGRQFKTLWFDDDLDNDLKVKATDKKPTAFVREGANDLYEEATDTDTDTTFGNVTYVWQTLVDDDNDPTSDFGKIDLVSADDDPTTADNETTHQLEACDFGRGSWNEPTDWDDHR